MTEENRTGSQSNPVGDSIATAVKVASELSQTVTNQIAQASTSIGQTVSPALYKFVEQGTEAVGGVVTPIADNPMVKYATKLPVVNWLLAALGQVDEDKVQQDVAKLRQQYPLETPEQLANRVITDAAFQAARIGLMTNFVPPLALMLFAVDLTAIAALQAEMVYRIAAVYGFPPQDAARRGEVLIIWGMSTGGSSLVKTGLSFVELLPLVGTAIGITSNAAILYSLGRVACLFYEEKLKATP